ncbi:MAG TPA: hypothetical protein VF719_06255 [Abditibacteriaceae bacterium]|jgi:WD40 repeat protein
MPRLSRAEIALFLLPVLIVPAAFWGQKWNVSRTTKPMPSPTPTPKFNLYSNFRSGSILPSPDGRFIYTGSGGNPRFRKWNAQSGALLQSFGAARNGTIDGVSWAALSPDGRTIGFYRYQEGQPDRVVLLDTATNKERLQIQAPSAEGFGFSINNELVALPDNDSIRLYSATNGKLIKKLRHRVADFYPSSPQFSPDGKILLWIGETGEDGESYANGKSHDEIVWFDWKKGKCLGAIELHHTGMENAKFSGDGEVILARGGLWSWVKGQKVKRVAKAGKKFFAIDAITGKRLYTWNLGFFPSRLTVSPNGKWFALADTIKAPKSASEYLSLYEVRTGRKIHHIPGFDLNTNAWSADSKTFLYADTRLLQRLRLQPDGSWKLNKNRSL